MNETKSMIITAAVADEVGKCNGDAADVVALSEVDWPPWLSHGVRSTRRCSHVTVNSVACRKYGTDLTCRFVERQADICKTSIHCPLKYYTVLFYYWANK